MAELAEMEDKQRQKGLLFDDAAPIKLDLTTTIQPEPKVKEEKKPEIKDEDKVKVRPKPAVFGEGDDEEEEAQKKKRTLIKLEYGDGLTEGEKIAKRNAKLLEIRSGIPKDRKTLWGTRIEWAAIGEVSFLSMQSSMMYH